jgi:hypothetical protein
MISGGLVDRLRDDGFQVTEAGVTTEIMRHGAAILVAVGDPADGLSAVW